MQERATYVGGALNIKSALGKGTTVLAQIPLIDRKRKRGKCR
jgi:signal transduction histidine kinase